MFIMFIMFIMFTPPKHGISTYFMGFDPSPFLHWGPAGAFLRPRWCGAAGDGENGLNPAMLDAFQACVASLIREACVRI